MLNGQLEALLERVLACVDTDFATGKAIFVEDDEVIDDLLLDIRSALYGDEDDEETECDI